MKKNLSFLLYLIVLVAGMIAFICHLDSNNTPYIPSSEEKFINIISKYQSEAVQAKNNSLLREKLARDRQEELQNSDIKIDEWIGIAKSVGHTLGGDVRLDIEIGNGILLRFFGKENEPIVKALKTVRDNSIITFSGNFLNEYAEKSLTISGGLGKPEYDIYISSIYFGIKDGVVNSYYDNDIQKESEITYKMGKKEGRAVTYYRNGKIKTKSYYKNNKLNGKATFYNQDGEITSEVIFKDGIVKQ